MLPGGVHILCMITGLFNIQIMNGISQRRLGTERNQSNDTANQQGLPVVRSFHVACFCRVKSGF